MTTLCTAPPPADPWHYAILGVPFGAPLAECIAAYDRLVAEFDPRRADYCLRCGGTGDLARDCNAYLPAVLCPDCGGTGYPPAEQGKAIDLQNALNDAIDAITGACGGRSPDGW